MKSKFIWSVCVAFGLSACNSNSGDDVINYDASAVIVNITDQVIVVTYTELASQANAMKTAIDSLNGVDDIDSGRLAAAQTAWKNARGPWERSEGFLIGPVASLGIDPKLDTWPLNTAALATAVNTGFNTSASEDVQGFHTLEYLLFGDGVDGNNRSMELSSGELAYVKALAADFVGHTQILADAWSQQYDPSDVNTGPYANELKLQGDGLYLSQLAVMEELINGMLGIVDEVANGKIADPFGLDLAGADTSLVESQYSWNSLTDFHNNIQSVLNIYTGKKGYDPALDGISTGLNGIYAFVYAHDALLADRVLDEIVVAMDKIGLIDGDGIATTTDISDPATQMPFRNAIKDSAGRQRIASAIAALSVLQGSLQNQVLPLLASTQFQN